MKIEMEKVQYTLYALFGNGKGIYFMVYTVCGREMVLMRYAEMVQQQTSLRSNPFFFFLFSCLRSNFDLKCNINIEKNQLRKYRAIKII